MAANFYSQAVPAPCFVLGLQLLPLSLGHLLLLHRIESVFVTTSEVESDAFQEIALAVAICAQPYRDGVAMLSDPATPRAMLKWVMTLTRTRIIDRLMRRKPVAIPMEREWQAFRDYLCRNMEGPHFSFDASKSKPMSCPEVQHVRVLVQRAFGISDESILDRPWVQCLWDSITLKAIDGQIQMTDKDEISDAQELANRIEANMARRGVRNGAS